MKRQIQLYSYACVHVQYVDFGSVNVILGRRECLLKQELIGSVILYMGVSRRIHVHCGRTMALLHAA